MNESDTVIIITDMLSEVFGYDKYSGITSEYLIKGGFCDLATKEFLCLAGHSGSRADKPVICGRLPQVA